MKNVNKHEIINFKLKNWNIKFLKIQIVEINLKEHYTVIIITNQCLINVIISPVLGQ